MRLSILMLLAVIAGAADYYVSPSGSDTNAGTSTAAPWKTVAKVNGRSFAAGDRVYFQGGQVFSDAGLQLYSDESGTAGNPIVIGSYGTGRATLSPPANAHAIDIYNTAGLHIRDLILVGPGLALSDTNGKRGLQAYCDLAGGVKLPYLRVENVDISAFHEGITIGAWNTSFSGFQDVLITGCTIHDNLGNGLATYGYSPGSASQQSHANLQVVSCEVMRNYGDPTLSNPAGQHSGSGIIISGVKGGLVDRCYVHNNGGSAGDNAGGGPVGIWTYASDSVVMQRSLVHDQKTTPGAVDGGGFDIDGGATNAVVQYCYSYGNEGPGYLVAEYTGATPLQNGIFRYNVSWRDGRRMAMASGFHFWSGENLTSECQDIRVYNNLVYTENATGGACVTYQSGPMAGLRMWNNIFVVQGGERFVDIGSNTGYFTFQGNLYWATDALWTGGWKWGATTYTTLDSWRAAAGTPETLAGSPVGVQADPLVANLIAGEQPTSVAAMEAMTAFKLLAGSPAIDAGQDLRTAAFGSLDVGVREFWNNAIPQGAAFDIGPHESTPTVSTYTISYDANSATSGTAPASQTKTHAVALTLATNSGALARSGYSFAGWNTAADGSGTSYAVGVSYTANAAVTLYAKWTASTYTVTYNANSATSGTAPASQTKTHAVALTLATNSGALARSGYSFAGWNTAAEGSGTSYAVGASYTADAAVTLYAKWTALPTYTVSYDANTATSGTAPASQTKTQGVALTLATNSGSLARTGYAFAGWSTLANGTGTDYAVGASYTADAAVTLYAKWTALPTYTVSYDANAATSGTAPASQTKTQGVALTLATNTGGLAKSGFTFAGWNTAANGTGTDYAVGASYTADAAVTLYAKWTALPTYTVSYDANAATSGTSPASQTKTQGVSLTLATNSGSLARTGYTFAGWNTLANGTGTDYAVGASYTADAAVTLYAKWTALPTYTVSYDANAATSGTAPASQTKTQGVALTLATNTGGLAKSGFTFAGWNTAANGTGTDYAVGASYTADAAVTLYAKWTALPTYTVSYDANAATSGTSPASQTKTQGVSLTLATNSGSLARTGYTFVGWNTLANGTGTDYAVGASYTADAAVTLYAKWTALPTYTVSYDANVATSGTAPASQTKTQGVALTLATNTGGLAKSGFTFAGWNTAANGTGTDYAVGASYTVDAAVTLYAKWTALPTYTVTGVITVTGSGIAGVTVSDGTRTAITAADGTYVLTGVPAGSYVLMPILLGYSFTPASIAVTVTGDMTVGQTFQATPVLADGDGGVSARAGGGAGGCGAGGLMGILLSGLSLVWLTPRSARGRNARGARA
jgi:uncharacterized repeat protein (TIGR02543 family)